jgi:hypothetical protein
MPGEGVEPPCPKGTLGFKPSASDQFRHPGGNQGKKLPQNERKDLMIIL